MDSNYSPTGKMIKSKEEDLEIKKDETLPLHTLVRPSP